MKKFLYICFLFWVNSVFLMAQEKKRVDNLHFIRINILQIYI